MTKLNITEIFYSVQGEGPSIGIPSIFIRLSGCNLKCPFCDTKYSLTGGLEYTIPELLKEIQKYPCHRVVITGGEPLLQREEVIKLIKSLPVFYYIEIETNGTISPGPILLQYVDQWNISPKTKQTLMDIKQTPLSFGVHTDKLFIKLVVEKDLHQLDWALNFYKNNKSFPSNHIILMPECRTREEHNKNFPQIIEFAKIHNFRITPRLHIILYNGERAK